MSPRGRIPFFDIAPSPSFSSLECNGILLSSASTVPSGAHHAFCYPGNWTSAKLSLAQRNVFGDSVFFAGLSRQDFAQNRDVAVDSCTFSLLYPEHHFRFQATLNPCAN